MAPITRLFLTLLLAIHTATARHLALDSQAPLTSSFTTPNETQPIQIGSYDSTKFPPNQFSCSKNPRVAYDNAHGGITTTLLTFQYPPPGKFKYCWLELNAPNPAKPGDGNPPRVIVRWFKPGQSCPAPQAIDRQSDLGNWLLAGGKGGNATWDNRSGDFLNYPMRSTCPPGGGIVGIEVVPPQGANFELSWNQDPKLKGQGVRLLFSN